MSKFNIGRRLRRPVARAATLLSMKQSDTAVIRLTTAMGQQMARGAESGPLKMNRQERRWKARDDRITSAQEHRAADRRRRSGK